jgi:hypothetical protein
MGAETPSALQQKAGDGPRGSLANVKLGIATSAAPLRADVGTALALLLPNSLQACPFAVDWIAWRCLDLGDALAGVRPIPAIGAFIVGTRARIGTHYQEIPARFD